MPPDPYNHNSSSHIPPAIASDRSGRSSPPSSRGYLVDVCAYSRSASAVLDQDTPPCSNKLASSHYASLAWGLSVCIPASRLWPASPVELMHVLLFYPWRLLYIRYGISHTGSVTAITILVVTPIQYLVIRLALRRAAPRPDTISSICFIIRSPPSFRKYQFCGLNNSGFS